MSSQDHVEGVQLYTDLSCFTEPMSSQDHVEGVRSTMTCPALAKPRSCGRSTTVY